MMRTQDEIKEMIEIIEEESEHILNREVVKIQINAPVALMQIAAESKLKMLYWVLGVDYASTLKR